MCNPVSWPVPAAPWRFGHLGRRLRQGLLFLAGALGVIVSSPNAQEQATAPASPPPLPYFVVVTGGELLEGVYPDAHTPYLTRTLHSVGCQCVGSIIVDDHRQEILEALRFATNHAALVIVTGGLGPTPNDITRETLAEFAGATLAENDDVLTEMERRFGQRRDQLRPNLRRQSRVPTSGRYLRNPIGTAVGLVFEAGGPVVIALPGPPKELQAMVQSELLPYLRQRFGVREFGSSVTLRFVGVGQSYIDQTIKDHLQIAPDVVITSLFEGGRVDFTFSLPGHSPSDTARLKQLAAEIRVHLEDSLYATDRATLEEVVLQSLRAKEGKLAVLDLGTGGALAAALNSAALGTAVLAGAYVAPNETSAAALLGLAGLDPVSNDSGAALHTLAKAAAAKAGTEAVLAVGPVQVDAKANRSLLAGLQVAGRPWETHRLTVGPQGEMVGANLVTPILDWVRRRLRAPDAQAP